ncbi:MAG: DHH family phosphoesterase [Candidatus Diapherotrites archaeon]|nr:DHH family phosphoesterase [Candidatus Diapherotrites archaeon]
MDKAALLSGFSDFLDSLAGTDRMAIFHHNDPDGVCSGLIVFLALQRLPVKPEIVLVKPIGYEACKNTSLAQTLGKKKADKAIMVDVCVDQFPDCPKEMEKNLKRFLIIDHHKKYCDLNSEKTVFIKAVDMEKKLDPSRYINAKLTFDLFSKKANLEDLAWIACVGILGDMGYETWKGFFKKTQESNKISLAELKRLENLIQAVAIVKSSELPGLFREFAVNAKTPKRVFKSRFIKFEKILKKEIETGYKHAVKGMESFPELGLEFYKVESKNKIKSYVVNMISREKPDTTIILAQCSNGRCYFSARRQDFKIKMNELAETAVKGIPNASGGGHVPAAAGSFPSEFKEQFKENVKRILAEKMKK